MKKFKHIKTGHIIEESNPNHYSIYLRSGYKEIKAKPKKVELKK